MKAATAAKAATGAPEPRRVFVMLPLFESERIALRHQALDARLPMVGVIRERLGFPARLPPPEPRPWAEKKRRRAVT